MDSRKRDPNVKDRGGAGRGRRQPKPAGRVRVVIADDDPLVLNEIGRILEARFDVVKRVGNGRELVDATRKLSPSVVVTDVTMPEMNGIEATRLITANHKDVKVVVLSVHDDPAIIESAYEAGASAYVPKLTAPVALIPAIEDVLAGRVYHSRRLD
jgi:DNA-binding NarL/FixJ family response regulator